MASTDALARRRQGLLIAAALGYLLWQGSQLFLAFMPSASPAKPALTVASRES